jgi:hypothetical protein
MDGKKFAKKTTFNRGRGKSPSGPEGRGQLIFGEQTMRKNCGVDKKGWKIV